jgi:hypothetical protein
MTEELDMLMDRSRFQALTSALYRLEYVVGRAVRKMVRGGVILERDSAIAQHVLCSTAIAELIVGYADRTGASDDERASVLRSTLAVLLEHPQISEQATKAWTRLQKNKLKERVGLLTR